MNDKTELYEIELKQKIEGMSDFIVNQLNQYVFPYIFKHDIMLYDKENPIYLEWIKIGNDARKLQEFYEKSDNKEREIEITRKFKEIYERMMNLIGKVEELKKNETNNQNRVL